MSAKDPEAPTRHIVFSAVSVVAFFTAMALLLIGSRESGKGTALFPFAPHYFLLGALAALAVALLASIRWLTVAKEAIRLRWLFFERVIDYDEVERVEARRDLVETSGRGFGRQFRVQGYLRISLRSGDVIDVSTSDDGRVVERIGDMRALRTRTSASRALSGLARDERSVADWVRHLKRAGGARGDYRRADRAADLSEETLWSVVESPWQRAADRAAAAVALHARFDRDARERLRVVARDIDEPELRTVVSQAAEDAADDEALIASLEALEEATKRP